MAKVNFPAKEKANVTRPCLVAACRGNENIADLLNYLIYEAQDIAEKLNAESNEIALQLSHDRILNRPKNAGKRFNFTEKSLIGYLHKLNEWGLVTSEKYGRSLVVHIDAINILIANPPEQASRKKTGGRKSCNVETLEDASTLQKMLKISNEKVGNLQEKVELLQLKVGNLQQIVGNLQLLISSNPALQATPEAKICALYSVDTVYSVDFFTGATFRSDDDDLTAPLLGEKKGSYSQGITEPTPEEKKYPSMIELFAELDAKMDALDAEYSSRLQENKAHQSINPPLFQDVVPVEKSGVPKLPDMTKDVLQQDVRAVTPAQQKRIDAAERKAEEKRVKDREADLWRMAERIASVVVETKYATDSVKAMAKAKMPLEDIEIIMRKFADAGMFDLTRIANYLPTYAARKLRKQPDEPAKITPFPSKSYQPAQPEVIPWKSKTPRNLGAHLNPADYDEEPYVVSR